MNRLPYYASAARPGYARPVSGLGDLKRFFGDGSDGTLTSTSSITYTVGSDSGPVVKQFGGLTLSSGHTMTVSNRCKGLILYATSNVTINGTVNMDGKAANVALLTSYPIVLPLNVEDGLYHPGQAWTTGKDSQFAIGLLGGRGGDGGSGGVSYAYNFGLGPDDGRGGAGGAGGMGSWFGGGPGGGGGGGGACKISEGAKGGAGGNGWPPGTAGGAGGASVTATTANKLVVGNNGSNGSGGSGAAVTHIPGDPAQSGAGGSSTGGGGAGGGGGAATDHNATSTGQPGKAGTGWGGGLFAVIAKGNITIGANGSILARGSNGSSGGRGDVDNAVDEINHPCAASGGGGGGGAGGGIVLVAARGTYTNNGTVNVVGGSGGTGGVEDMEDDWLYVWGHRGSSGRSGSSGMIVTVTIP